MFHLSYFIIIMSSTATDADSAQTLLSIAQNLNGIIGLLIIIFGVPANFFAVLFIFQVQSWKKVTSAVVLFACILSNQCILIFLIPRVYFGWTGIDPTNSSLFLCKTRLFIAYSCSGFSISCICFIGIDQYLLSCPQAYRHRILTPRRTKLVLFSFSIFWLTAYIPHTIFYTLVSSFNGTVSCVNINSNYTTYVAYFSLICYAIFPVIILLLLTLFILRNLHRFDHIRRRRSALQNSVTRVMTILIIIVLMSTLPTSINQLYMLITRFYVKSRLRLAVEYLILTILSLIVYLSYCPPLFVFIFGSNFFRERTKRIIAGMFTHLRLCLRLHTRNGRIEPHETATAVYYTRGTIQTIPMPHVQTE